MSLLSRTTDAVYAFRFLRLLTTPWDQMKAHKLGLIDDRGKKIRKPSTSEEKAAYNYFHRLVFNIKRIVSKAPGGSRYLVAYAAALFLLREHTGMSEKMITETMIKAYPDMDTQKTLYEAFYIDMQSGKLLKGTYKLQNEIADSSTGEVIGLEGSRVQVAEHTEPSAVVFGAPVYEVVHVPTKRVLIVSSGDLSR